MGANLASVQGAEAMSMDNPPKLLFDMLRQEGQHALVLESWNTRQRVHALLQDGQMHWNTAVIAPDDRAAVSPLIGQIKKEYFTHWPTADQNPKQEFALVLALEEAIVNAVKYNPTTPTTITYGVTDGKFLVHINDHGEGFRPQEIPNPNHPENLEVNHGRGNLLIAHYMGSSVSGVAQYLPLTQQNQGENFLTTELVFELPLPELSQECGVSDDRISDDSQL